MQRCKPLVVFYLVNLPQVTCLNTCSIETVTMQGFELLVKLVNRADEGFSILASVYRGEIPGLLRPDTFSIPRNPASDEARVTTLLGSGMIIQ